MEDAGLASRGGGGGLREAWRKGLACWVVGRTLVVETFDG